MASQRCGISWQDYPELRKQRRQKQTNKNTSVNNNNNKAISFIPIHNSVFVVRQGVKERRKRNQQERNSIVVIATAAAAEATAEAITVLLARRLKILSKKKKSQSTLQHLSLSVSFLITTIIIIIFVMQTLENTVSKYTGGVEEEKEEAEFRADNYLRQDSTDTAGTATGVGDERGFRAQLEEFSKFFLGSCGNAWEAASSVIRDKTCRWHGNHNGSPIARQQQLHQQDVVVPPPPPLSIADELKRLAAQQPQVVPRRAADIPRFLGEDAVYSFEDDNVSAISQHTLEEMARRNTGPDPRFDPRLLHPLCKQESDSSPNPPGRTRSSTSSK